MYTVSQSRSRSMPFINHVHPSQYPQIQKLKLVPTDSMASNGSFFGYGSKGCLISESKLLVLINPNIAHTFL